MISYLANSLWQLPLFFTVAWLIIRTTLAGPRLQHRIWIAALLLAVLTPALNLRAVSFSQTSPLMIAAPNVLNNSKTVSRERARTPASSAIGGAGARKPLRLSPHFHRVTLAPEILPWMFWTYLASILIGALRLSHAWFVARRMLQRSTPAIVSPKRTADWAQCADRMRLPLPPLRTSSEVTSPALVGVLRTVLLLPVDFAQVNEEDAQATLFHELAHLRRRDCLANLLIQLTMLPVRWHPVTRALARRISVTREMVCDAMAAQAMHSGRRYARSLVSLARQLLPHTTAHQPTIGLFSTNSLEERVMRIINPGRVVSLRIKLLRAASVSCLAAGTFLVVMLVHLIPVAASSTPQASPVKENPTAPAPAETLAAPPAPICQGAPSVSPLVHARALAAKPSLPPTYLTAAAQDHPATTAIVQPEDVQRQVDQALSKLDMHKVDKQAQKVQRQVEEAMDSKLDSPEFKRQMEVLQKQLQASERQLQSQWPEWNKQIEEAQRQAAEVTAKLNSPEFKHQIEAMTKQIQNGELERQVKEAERRVEELQKQWNEVCPR